MTVTDPHCVDCGVDVYEIHEYEYMVKTTVWTAAGFSRPFLTGDGMACISCLEKRLGRQLTRNDFEMETPINHSPYKESRLLRSRRQV